MDRVVPMNAAEAIISPFWDPAQEELARWKVEPGSGHGLEVYQFWCWTGFEWTRRPEQGPALRMSRTFDVSCVDYDTLIVSIVAPESSVLRVYVRTDRRVVEYESVPAPPSKREHTIPLPEAARILGITLEVDEGASAERVGWLNWIGLQASSLLPAYERQWRCWDETWKGYLKPHSYKPTFAPTYGILVNARELDELRSVHDAHVKARGTSPFVEAAEALRGVRPERSIGEYVGFYSSTRKTTDTRYNRERDESKMLVLRGQDAAVGALLLKDAELLRLAARYALSLAMCSFWEDGMINRFPGSTFDTRCFVQSLCLHDIAMILDLAGEMFTDLGRDYLLRRLSQEGLATVTYNTWKYEYLFECNQLAWFTPGRMYAYLVVERNWPRAKPYTELCYNDLVENMQLSILDDGGYVEGPNYFQCVGRDENLSFYYYARARGLELSAIVPEKILRSADFGAVVESTDERQDVIPICDAKPNFDQTAMVFLSHLSPGGAWSRMLARSLDRIGIAESLAGMMLTLQRPTFRSAPPSLVVLREMGVAASHRTFADRSVKILIMGNKAGAGHTHEDKGSFVLEFAGETFAMDPGTADYSRPLSGVLKQCQRHNMLTPFGVAERPRPANPIDVDVKPEVDGDDTRFSARIDVSPGWERYYRRWTRSWSSPTPQVLVVTDEYELVRGSGVEFRWQTELDVEIDGTCAKISGRNGVVRLDGPEGCALRVEEHALPGERRQRTIVFSRDGAVGRIEVRAELVVRRPCPEACPSSSSSSFREREKDRHADA